MGSERKRNGKDYAITGLLVGVIVFVLLWYFGQDADPEPWYYRHLIAIGVGGIPLLAVVGWFIGISIPAESPEPTPQPSIRNHCTQCGNPRQPGDVYCAKCGAPLT